MSTEREKWHTNQLPKGYPSQINLEELRDVIQDLNDEYVTKTRNGKNNVIWERLISNLIKSGRDELTQRKKFDQKKSPHFSMDNPIVYIIVILILAGIAYFTYKFGWPLRFGSD